MRKLLALGVAAAALFVVAVSAPANAAVRNADGVQNGQAVAMDLSARRYHRRYVYRYGPRYGYYARPYYYGYPYGYYPYGYYPYPYPYYYRRPGIYFGFGF
jgi:hypothetical protein